MQQSGTTSSLSPKRSSLVISRCTHSSSILHHPNGRSTSAISTASSYRLRVSVDYALLMSEWIVKEIFLRKTPAQLREFAAKYDRLLHRLIRPVFTFFHFLEVYRSLLILHDGPVNRRVGQTRLDRGPYYGTIRR